MSELKTWRNAIRQQLADEIPVAHVYVTADADSFLDANAWEGPALVVEFDKKEMVEDENRLVGQGEQLRQLLFNVYIAIRGGDIDLQNATPDDDLDILSTNEQVTSGVFDMIENVEQALMFHQFDDDPSRRCLSRGWEKYAHAPMVVVYVTRWRLAGDVIRN